MSVSKKTLKYSKYGFNGSHKKIGVNYWRFFFSGISSGSGIESKFCIELEMLNPWYSPSEPLLGYKPRIKIKEDDLQYALAGTDSAHDIQSEKIVTPSYVAIRVSKMDSSPKQLCSYFGIKSVKFNAKPYEIIAGDKVFTENDLSGQIELSDEDIRVHPEYLCDSGFAKWNLKYDVVKDSENGYENQTDKWFPLGLRSCFTGSINFDGEEYIVEPKKSVGYMDRYWGKTFPSTWFHLSSTHLTSNISGKTLFNSGFTLQGIFDNKLSFLCDFEGVDVNFCIDNDKYSVVYNCVEAPDVDIDEDKRLHWSVSINSKFWVVDVDVFCKIKNLYNKQLELPEGHRKLLNIVQSATGNGEIKLYKKHKEDLEQIEFARISNAICEFGQIEDGNI